MGFLSKLAILILLISTFFLFPYYHELGHQQIYKAEMTESSIGIDWKGWHTSSKGCQTEECEISQNFHESIAYNLQPIFLMIMTLLVILIIQKEERNEDLKEILEKLNQEKHKK